MEKKSANALASNVAKLHQVLAGERGQRGEWKRFSNASLEDWGRCVELLESKRS